MTNHKPNLPQPIPYPQNCLARNLLKTPILLYQLGLGKLYGKFILILTSTGRKTHQVRRTPLEFFEQDGRIYVISGFGSQPDWYRNIQADPCVTIQSEQGTLHAVARPPKSEQEWQAVYNYLTHSPVGTILMGEYLENLEKSSALEEVKRWPAITFDPTEKPCPPALETDLVWTWPIIFLLGALNILVGWLICRRK